MCLCLGCGWGRTCWPWGCISCGSIHLISTHPLTFSSTYSIVPPLAGGVPSLTYFSNKTFHTAGTHRAGVGVGAERETVCN